LGDHDPLFMERDRLVAKLESFARLTSEEKGALLDLPMTLKRLPADVDIVREGDRPGECCLLLEGWACRYRILSDGRRQILSFCNPGDMPDILSLRLKVMDHNLGTLTPVALAVIPHRSLDDIALRFPAIMAAFWRDTLIDAAIFREWMVSIGRRTAQQRVAHILCELVTRLRAVGLADGHACDLPLTQTELADALGLTNITVNRVLQDLRRDGLITLQRSALSVDDWDGLIDIGEFDPAYLHQDRGVGT